MFIQSSLSNQSTFFQKIRSIDYLLLLTVLIIGIISAAVVSWIAIDWFLKYLQSNKTWIFVMYRLMFGLALLIWWSSN